MGSCATHDLSTPLRRLTFDKQHRAMFRPNLYHTPPDHPDPDSGSANVEAQQTPSVLKRVWRGLKRVFNALNPFRVKAFKRRLDTPRTSQTVGSQAAQFKTDRLEVWFSGCHSGMHPIRACPPFRGGGGGLELDLWPNANRSRITSFIPQILAGEPRRTLTIALRRRTPCCPTSLCAGWCARSRQSERNAPSILPKPRSSSGTSRARIFKFSPSLRRDSPSSITSATMMRRRI